MDRLNLLRTLLCVLFVGSIYACGSSSSDDDDSDDEAQTGTTPIVDSPVDRGTYTYRRIPDPGIAPLVEVAMHPDGSYLLALSQNGEVHVLDTATDNIVSFDPSPAASSLIWEFVHFDAGGQFALFGGQSTGGTGIPVLFRFDDAAWRAFTGDTMTLYSEYLTLSLVAGTVAGITPRQGANPVLLTRADIGMGNYTATLYDFDPGSGMLTLLTATATSAGCEDIAAVANSFGDEGFLVVCGINGSDAFYYTNVGGTFVTQDPSSASIGNISSAVRHPVDEYALVVDWSGRRLYRFENDQFSSLGDTPNFPLNGIWSVAFNPDGSRALIFGRAGVAPSRLTVIEYRHDLYDCLAAFGTCELTEVSIPNFDMAPYFGDTNFWAYAAAWRSDCDGGVLAGGDSGIGATGILIEFQLVSGAPC